MKALYSSHSVANLVRKIVTTVIVPAFYFKLSFLQEIRILHHCKMPSGAKEIAKEAVKLKRENAKLQACLDDVINNEDNSHAPIDVILREKVENYKADSAIMVKKIVFYQSQLKDLMDKYPEANIELEYDIKT